MKLLILLLALSKISNDVLVPTVVGGTAFLLIILFAIFSKNRKSHPFSEWPEGKKRFLIESMLRDEKTRKEYFEKWDKEKSLRSKKS